MRTAFAPRLFCLLLVLLAPCVGATGPATYTGTAPVNSQSDEERTSALKTALANVVVAQTGDSSVLARADVAKAVGQAERYVLQYQYQPATGADAPARLLLVAQFDSAAVDQMLGQLGLGGSATDQAALAETPSEATVWIGGIADGDDYVRVIAYLGRNNFVRSAQPLRAHGDGLAVKLSLATDLAHFLDAVGMERTLEVAGPAARVDGVDATLALAK